MKKYKIKETNCEIEIHPQALSHVEVDAKYYGFTLEEIKPEVRKLHAYSAGYGVQFTTLTSLDSFEDPKGVIWTRAPQFDITFEEK